MVYVDSHRLNHLLCGRKMYYATVTSMAAAVSFRSSESPPLHDARDETAPLPPPYSPSSVVKSKLEGERQFSGAATTRAAAAKEGWELGG